MVVVSINAGAQVVIILLACGPCMVIVNCWDRLCTLGRAPRTKETLPDFYEWCRVTRHPRIFRRLTDFQQTPEFWGITNAMYHCMLMSCLICSECHMNNLNHTFHHVSWTISYAYNLQIKTHPNAKILIHIYKHFI